MTFDYNDVERVAREMCERAGSDYDAKWAKRAHWRDLAQKELLRRATFERNSVLRKLVKVLAA